MHTVIVLHHITQYGEILFLHTNIFTPVFETFDCHLPDQNFKWNMDEICGLKFHLSYVDTFDWKMKTAMFFQKSI